MSQENNPTSNRVDAKQNLTTERAIILTSGGLDSTTLLAIAKDAGYALYALSFDYGQRHKVELEAADYWAQKMQAREHRIIRLALDEFGGSALTDLSMAVPDAGQQQGIPSTYVPARNTLFLSHALAWAEVSEIDHIFIGVNAVDYSGYPDCRGDYIRAFEAMANLATKRAVSGMRLHIHTPLIDLSKSQIIHKGVALGVDYSQTVSCYQADAERRACGRCDSCLLRRQGFIEADIIDPTRYQGV